MAEELKIRTRISKGFQVVVPAELRKQYKLGVGDSAYAALMDGMRLAWAFSEAAVSWGNESAKAWRSDASYASFLGRFLVRRGWP